MMRSEHIPYRVFAPMDLAWLAGLLEGEGCFTMRGTAMVSLGMTDLDVIEKARRIVNAPTLSVMRHSQTHWKTQYKWNLCGQPAADLMEALLPFMGERRSQRMRDIISVQRLRKPHRAMVYDCSHVGQRAFARGMCRRCYQRDWLRAKRRANICNTEGVAV